MSKEQEIIIKGEENILKQFEGKGVEIIIDENGEPLFELYSTGMALGYVKKVISKGKEYTQVRKDRIDKVMKNGSIAGLPHYGKTFLNEEMLYDFMLECHTEKCKPFRKWVTSDVLPSIRKHGAYISDNEKSVDQDYIKYTYGQLKNTFINCAIENLTEIYEDCMEWHKQNKTKIPYAKNSKKRCDAKHKKTNSRIMIMQKIISTLEIRNVSLCEAGKFGFVSELDKVIKQIKDDIKKQYNLINRSIIGNKTKKINKLQDELHSLTPSESEYITLNVHGYSHNSMYRHENGIGTVKTNGYNTWIQYFPRYEIPTKEYYETNYNIDFTKPIAIYLKYVCKDSYDIRNLDKSTLDMIFNRVLCVDDNIVEYVSSEKVGSCTKYEDGKIIFAIRNL